jgi:DNA polymerase-3 subunit alpha
MGKKKKSELDKQYEFFEKGMRDNGYSAAAIKALWDILLPFSDYAFNKAHTAGYGLVSYWTAYLKANYPAEYMAALLTSVKDDKDKSALYLNECRRMGITVNPPDVNESDADFTPKGDTEIRFGLSAIRNVGDNVVEGIVAARKEKGRYTDFNDFLRKVPPLVCNKRVVESLIKAGAFDSLGHHRKALVLIHEQAIDSVIDVKRNEAIGQDSLFGGMDDDGGADEAFSIDIPQGEWDKTTLLTFEREMLGLYVSDHPLLGVEHILAKETDISIGSLSADNVADGQVVTIGGLLSGLQRKVTKQGNSWAMFSLEDLEGAIEVMAFPSAYQLCSTLLAEDTVLVVKGRVDKREDMAKIIAMEVTQPDLTITDSGAPFAVSMHIGRCIPETVERLKEVLTTHPGNSEVHLHLQNGPRTTVVRLDDRLRVAPSPALMGDLKQLLGPACLMN